MLKPRIALHLHCLVSHVIVEFPNGRHTYVLRTYFKSWYFSGVDVLIGLILAPSAYPIFPGNRNLDCLPVLLQFVLYENDSADKIHFYTNTFAAQRLDLTQRQKWTRKWLVVRCMSCKTNWLLHCSLHRLFYRFLFYCYFFLQVAIGLIRGKATHIVWPPSRWQRLENFTSEGRLAFEKNNPLSEFENGTDTFSDTDAETQTEKNSTCRSYVDRDSNSVPEFMYGPTI